MWCQFSPGFKVFLLSLAHNILTICVDVDLFVYILLVATCSWICRLMFIIVFGEFSAIISLNIFSALLFSASVTPLYTNAAALNGASNFSVSVFIFFSSFLLFFFLFFTLDHLYWFFFKFSDSFFCQIKPAESTIVNFSVQCLYSSTFECPFGSFFGDFYILITILYLMNSGFLSFF